MTIGFQGRITPELLAQRQERLKKAVKPQPITPKIVEPGEGDGFVILVGRADSKSDPKELVTVDGTQYTVTACSDKLEQHEIVDSKWVFDYDQEDDVTARLAALRGDKSTQGELKQYLIDSGVYRRAAATAGNHADTSA